MFGSSFCNIKPKWLTKLTVTLPYQKMKCEITDFIIHVSENETIHNLYNIRKENLPGIKSQSKKDNTF